MHEQDTARIQTLRKSCLAPFCVASPLFILLFVLYAYSAAPEVTFHDSGELIAAAATLGLTHPPGSPTWCLVAYPFTLIEQGSLAWRVHLSSALAAAGTCALVYLLIFRMLAGKHSSLSSIWAHLAGLTGALVLAQCPAFWDKAVQAELYALNAFFLLLILLVFYRWITRQNHHRSDMLLLVVAFLFGLGAGNYLAILYYAPVLALAILVHKRNVLKQVRLIIWGVLACLLGLSVFAYLPLRSLANPPMDWGNPESFAAFLHVLRRSQWGGFAPEAIQWAHVVAWIRSYDLVNELGLVSVVLMLPGFFLVWRRNRLWACVLTGSILVYAGLMLYMQTGEWNHSTNTDYFMYYGLAEFHIPIYAMLAIFAGVGLYAAIEVLARDGLVHANGFIQKCMAILLFGLSTLTVMGMRYPLCEKREYNEAYAYGKELLDNTPTGSWIITHGDNTAFVLYYMRFCTGLRDDVTLVLPSIKGTEALNKILDGDDKVSSKQVAHCFCRDWDGHVFPILNQSEPCRGTVSSVLFENPQHVEKLLKHVHPHGLLFSTYDLPYDASKQKLFWKRLLDQPGFRLRKNAPPDFRENMVSLLRRHAKWHHLQREYEMSIRLLAKAEQYATKPRPELRAVAADGFARSGQYKHANDLARSVLELDPDNKRAKDILRAINRTKGAVE